MLNDVEADPLGVKNRLLPYEDYQHFTRDDLVVGQEHAGDIVAEDLFLRHGTRYYLKIRARNVLGFENLATSEAIGVDVTPPLTGPLNNTAHDDLLPDFCDAAPTQRCYDAQAAETHRVVIDGVGSATAFNGPDALYDRWYQRVNVFFASNWDGFHDPESSLYQILVAWGTEPCGTDIKDWEDPHAHLNEVGEWTHRGLASPLLEGTVPDGDYYLSIKALNAPVFGGSGVVTVCHFQPLRVDTTPPVIVEVHDPLYDVGSAIIMLRYNASDMESWIRDVKAGLGRSRHDVYLLPWMLDCSEPMLPNGHCPRTRLGTFSINHFYLAKRIPGGLPEGVFIYGRLSVTNNVDLPSFEAGARPFLLDSSAPLPGEVDDGPYVGHDLYWENNATMAAINVFGFSDPESGIGRYEWCLGTVPFGCDVFDDKPWPVPATAHAARVSVLLQHNVTYYSTVTAFNQGLEIRNVSAVSDGVRVDTTPPVAGLVLDGRNASFPQIWTSEPGRMAALWLNFTDSESEVVEYYISVGRRRALGDAVDRLKPGLHLPATPVGCGDGSGFFDHKPSVRCNITTVRRRDMSFKHGETYYVAVDSQNGAHDRNASHSAGVTVDLTPPAVVSLGDGTAEAGGNRRFVASVDVFSANFVFEDPESGVVSIAWQLVEESFGGAVTRRIWPKDADQSDGFSLLPLHAQNVTLGSLALESRLTYLARFAVTNAAGRSHVYATDGVEIDLVPPLMLMLRVGVDAPGVPEPLPVRQADGTRAVLWANLQGILAFFQGTDDESGVAAFLTEVIVLEDVDGADLAGATIASHRLPNRAARVLESRGAFIKAELQRGALYRVCVRAEDLAGLLSNATCSTPVRVVADDVPGVAHVENAVDSVSHSLSLVSVRYWGFESERCGITGYSWAVGTRALGTDVLTYTRLGIATRQGRASLLIPLAQGGVYYATIRAETGCGNHLTAVAPAFTVDLLPPMLSNITVGLVDEDGIAGFQQSTRAVPVSLSAEDAEVGVDSVWVSLGSIPGGRDLIPWAALPGIGDGRRTDELSLPKGLLPGTAAVLSAVAESRGRLPSGAARAATLTADPTPPDAGSVSCPRTLGVGAFMQCSWDGFSDSDSGVARFVASLLIAQPAAADAAHLAPGDLLQPEVVYPGGRGSGDFTFAPELVSPPPRLSHGTQMRLQVTAFNGAGLSSIATSGIVTVDTTPPTTGEVRLVESHVAIDRNGNAAVELAPPSQLQFRCQRTRASLSVSWTGFADAEADIVVYEVSVGTRPGTADIMAAIKVMPEAGSGEGAVTLWEFDRQPNAGEAVFVTVVAVNSVGLRTGAVSPLLAFRGVGFEARVWDGQDASKDTDFQASATTLAATWDIRDPCPTVLYEWAIYDIAGNIVQPFVPLCLDGRGGSDFDKTNGTFAGASGDEDSAAAASAQCAHSGGADLSVHATVNDLLRLKEGVTYIALVRATNAAGDVVVLQSDGVTVTPYTPEPGIVYDGALPFADAQYQASTTALSASWRFFGGDTPDTDADKRKVEYYTISLGTNGNSELGRADVVPTTPIGQRFSVSFDGLTLVPRSQAYYATVRGVAANGRVSEATSNGILVGYTRPLAPGTVTLPAFQAATNSVRVTFTPFASPEGIWFYEVALGSSRRHVPGTGGTELLPFTCVCLGNFRCPDRKEGCRLEGELDGPGTEVLESIDDVAYRRRQGVVRLMIRNVTLLSHTPYYVTVRAVDRALSELEVQSRAMLVDTTAPLQPHPRSTTADSLPPVTVLPSQPADPGWKAAMANGAARFPDGASGAVSAAVTAAVAFVASRTEIDIAWQPFTDEESGVETYEVGVALSDGCDVPTTLTNVDFHRVDVNVTRTAITSPRPLRRGQAAVAVVRARNRAGLTSSAHSLPILLDSSPPLQGSVFAGVTTGKHAEFSPSRSELLFHFVEVARSGALECPQETLSFVKLPYGPAPPAPWLLHTAQDGLGRPADAEGPKQEFSALLAQIGEGGLELRTRRDRQERRLLASAASRKVPLMLHGRYAVEVMSAGRPGAVTSVYVDAGKLGPGSAELGFRTARLALYNGTFQMDSTPLPEGAPAPLTTAAQPANTTASVTSTATPTTQDEETPSAEGVHPSEAPQSKPLVPIDVSATSAFGIQIAVGPPPLGKPCSERTRDLCGPPCRFDDVAQQCARQHNVILWARTSRDERPLQVETIGLNFDPSVSVHRYAFDISSNEDENKEGGWALTLSIDSLPAATLYEVEAHKEQPATLTVAAWSVLSELPALDDILHPWEAVAYVREVAVRVGATPACIEGGAFMERESGLSFAVGLGTAPFLLDLRPLRPLAALSFNRTAVRWDSAAQALVPVDKPYHRQCEFSCTLEEAALEALLGDPTVTEACYNRPVVDTHVADMMVTSVHLVDLDLYEQSDQLDAPMTAVANITGW
jgi:hypothetical protein